MVDDIVKYLRLSRTRFNRNAEAADEIERLRKELADTRNDLRRIEMQQIQAARRWR